MTADDKAETSALAVDLSLATRSGLSDDLKVLLARYPREVWDSHANLGEMATFWLSRHAMFRELGTTLDEAAERFRSHAIDAEQFAGFFAPRLQFFLQQLHAHHHIEDHHYFPIFRSADTRLVRGFEMLEGDHDALAASIQHSIASANHFLGALNGVPADVQPAAEAYIQSGAILLRGLIRHLDDEEDLIVPLILHRGENALGVGH
jgi:hemerythrin-like domain-containing protein